MAELAKVAKVTNLIATLSQVIDNEVMPVMLDSALPEETNSLTTKR